MRFWKGGGGRNKAAEASRPACRRRKRVGVNHWRDVLTWTAVGLEIPILLSPRRSLASRPSWSKESGSWAAGGGGGAEGGDDSWAAAAGGDVRGGGAAAAALPRGPPSSSLLLPFDRSSVQRCSRRQRGLDGEPGPLNGEALRSGRAPTLFGASKSRMQEVKAMKSSAAMLFVFFFSLD